MRQKWAKMRYHAEDELRSQVHIKNDLACAPAATPARCGKGDRGEHGELYHPGYPPVFPQVLVGKGRHQPAKQQLVDSCFQWTQEENIQSDWADSRERCLVH